MPKRQPENAELVLVSPEDAELLDFFSLRRTFDPDGSIRYVQLIGDRALFEAAARSLVLSDAAAQGKSGKRGSYSLPRMIGQRMIGRPLDAGEVVVQTNGKRGDCRRSNLEVITRSEMAGGERTTTWSTTGVKYVYEAKNGRYYAQVGDAHLGTYNSVSEAEVAVNLFRTMVDTGMAGDEARTRVLNRSRNMSRILVME